MRSSPAGSRGTSRGPPGAWLVLWMVLVSTIPSTIAAQNAAVCRSDAELRATNGSVVMGGDLESPAHQVLDVAVDRSGSLYVADRASQEIVKVGADGGVQGRVGGEGEGPGEFETLFKVGVRGDTMWASDRSSSRITLFSTGGDVLETIAGESKFMGPRLSPVGPVGLSADGRPVGLSGFVMPMAARNPVIERPILTTDSSGSYTDTLAMVSSARSHVLMEDLFTSGSITAMNNPFGAHDPYTITPEGNRVIIVEQVENEALSDTVRVLSITLEGDTTTVYRSSHGTPVPLDEGVVQDSLEQIAAGYHMGAQASGWSTPEAAILEGIRDQFDAPEHVPPVVDVVSTGNGRVFVELWSSEPAESVWCVLGRDGSEMGVLRLEEGGDVVESYGSRLWVLREAEFSLKEIVRFQLSGGPAVR